MSDDEFVDNQGSGASKTYPVQCSSLRKNGYVMLKNRPCKIMEMSTSKTGKHGHAKVHLVGIDLYTGKKYEDLCPSTHNIEVPNVYRNDLTLIDITDDYVSLMDDKGKVREDIKLPNDTDLAIKIKEEFTNEKTILVTLMKAIDEEAIVGYKNATS